MRGRGLVNGGALPDCHIPYSCAFRRFKQIDTVEAVISNTIRVPLTKLQRMVSTARHLVYCSGPKLRAEVRAQTAERAHMLVNSQNSDNVEMKGLLSTRGMAMRTELEAVRRHLEVRWQLFNEALCKFGDLDTMLAICTDDVIWRHVNGLVIQGKNSPSLLENFSSLLNRKLSMEVEIKSITRLSPMVLLDMMLDQDGNCGQLEEWEQLSTYAALQMLLGNNRPGTRVEKSALNGVINGPYMLLERDHYTLKDKQGEVVEGGSRCVLWVQHNSAWYIRACLISPRFSKASK